MAIPQDLTQAELAELMRLALADFLAVLGKSVLVREVLDQNDDGELRTFQLHGLMPVTITGCELLSFDEGGNHCPRWYVVPANPDRLRYAEPGSFVWGVIRNEAGDVSYPRYRLQDGPRSVREWNVQELEIFCRRVEPVAVAPDGTLVDAAGVPALDTFCVTCGNDGDCPDCGR